MGVRTLINTPLATRPRLRHPALLTREQRVSHYLAQAFGAERAALEQAMARLGARGPASLSFADWQRLFRLLPLCFMLAKDTPAELQSRTDALLRVLSKLFQAERDCGLVRTEATWERWLLSVARMDYGSGESGARRLQDIVNQAVMLASPVSSPLAGRWAGVLAEALGSTAPELWPLKGWEGHEPIFVRMLEQLWRRVAAGEPARAPAESR